MRARPLGITIIAVLLAISGIASIVLGLEAAHITKFGLGAAEGSQAQGFGYLGAGILTLFVSFGFFSLQGWAWVLGVAVMILRIAVDLWALGAHGVSSTIGMSALGQIVISALILFYLVRPGVRGAFSR